MSEEIEMIILESITVKAKTAYRIAKDEDIGWGTVNSYLWKMKAEGQVKSLLETTKVGATRIKETLKWLRL